MELDFGNDWLDVQVGIHEPVSFSAVVMRHRCHWVDSVLGEVGDDVFGAMFVPVNVAIIGAPIRVFWARATCGLCGLDVACLAEVER